MIYDLQKASLMKRFSAFLLDIILMIILITGFAWMLSSMLGFSETSEQLDAVITKYEKQFGINFSITNDDYDKLTDEQKKHFEDSYNVVINDEEYIILTNKVFYSLITIVSISFLLSFAVLEFIVPLLF